MPFLPEPLPAGQVDQVVSFGVPGEVFEPRRTTHGFQYVRIEGHPDDLTAGRRPRASSCTPTCAAPAGSPPATSGSTASTRPRCGASADNACDVPTDCPHRERGPWTGDWQLYVPTAAFLYDVAGFSTKWLRDVAVDQWPDGTVANMSPSTRGEGRESPIAFLNGSAGWGDAAVIVPWELYRAYGDVQVLDELWPTMVRWLDRVERMARDQRHPDRAARSPEPAPHEQYLWDTGFHWGEWLVPGEEIGDFRAFVAADKGDVATAYFAYSAAADGADRRRCSAGPRTPPGTRELSEHVRAAWQAEYLDADGRLTPDTQANHVRALAFDLVPDELRPAVADRLVELIRKADTHLGTGFLATPYLLPGPRRHRPPRRRLRAAAAGQRAVLAGHGRPRRHHGVGAVERRLRRRRAARVAQPLLQGRGHLVPAPLHRRDRAGRARVPAVPGPAPARAAGSPRAEAAHESPYGRIESAWRIDGGAFELRVVVPAGTEAEVVLPDGTTSRRRPRRAHLHLHPDEESSR